MKKWVLVTGSEGYIGQHLIKMMSDRYNIRRLDIKGNHSWDITKKLKSGSIKFDAVVHLAALVRANESVENPWSYYNTNINGTWNVLNKIHYDNFIFASTGLATNPINPYSYSKRVAEDIVTEHCTKNKLDFTIFRFYNVIGSDGFDPTNPDGLFYNLNKAEETGVFNLCGTDYNTKDGTCIRDYIHVNEICNAIIKSIENPSGQIENLGTGVGKTVLEIIDRYKLTNQVDFEVINIGRRDGDIEVSVLDNPSSYYEQLYTFEEMLKV